jgi:hypothetical protein
MAGAGSRIKGTSIVAVVLGVLLFAVDFVWLKGEVVARDSAELNGTSPAVFSVSRIGEPHLVEIRTRRRVGGETRGRKVAWRLVDPDGVTIAQDEELLDHEERHFRFEPDVAGEYRLYVEDNGLLLRTETASARVSVTVNDRRLSRRLGFSL